MTHKWSVVSESNRHKLVWKTSEQPLSQRRIKWRSQNVVNIRLAVIYRSGYSTPQEHNWWTRSESNRQPSLCKRVALPIELQARKVEGDSGIEPDYDVLQTPR